MYLGKYRKQTNHVIKRYEQWQLQISKYSALHKKNWKAEDGCAPVPCQNISTHMMMVFVQTFKKEHDTVLQVCNRPTGKADLQVMSLHSSHCQNTYKCLNYHYLPNNLYSPSFTDPKIQTTLSMTTQC